MQPIMQPPPCVSYGPGLPLVATPVPTVGASVVTQTEVGFTQLLRKTMIILSGLQVAIGISCVIIDVVLISAHREYYSFMERNQVPLAAGTWCGGLYIIAGSLGVAAARQNRLSLKVSSMIFSIFSSVSLWVVIFFASFEVGGIRQDFNGYRVANIILIILSGVELVISIWCSVLCCKGGSCKAYKACKACGCGCGCCYGIIYGYPAQTQVTMQTPACVSDGAVLPPLTMPLPAMVASVIPQQEVGFTQRQKKTVTILSALQMAIGISCAIIYLVLICVHRKSSNIHNFDSVGAGIWCGVMYSIAGSLGVSAARQNRLCLIISSMVFSIISSLILWVVIGVAAKVIDEAEWDKTSCSYFYCKIYNYSGYQTADSILIVLSVTELFISIWCSVLCCQGSCKACKACCLGCCYGINYAYQEQMVYAQMSSAAQQVTFVQQNGVACGAPTHFLRNTPLGVDMQLPVNFNDPEAALSAAALPDHQHDGEAHIHMSLASCCWSCRGIGSRLTY